jgi:Zn ribbon nucleic-acid-binding protein
MALEPIGPRLRRQWEAAVQYYSAFHQRIEFELAFSLKLRHYLADTYQTLDQRYVKYRGRELASKLRRETADICAAPVYIEALPTDDDPERAMTAEDAKWALEHDIRDPLKGFDTFLERTVLGALSARVWWLIADYDPQRREIYFRNGDPTKQFICPPYQDVWDPRNPYWIEEVQMRVADAKAMPKWKNTDALVPDNPSPNRYNAGPMDTDERGRYFRDQASAPEPISGENGIVTVLKCWYKWDPDNVTKKVPRPDSYKKLDPDEQHLACVKCGYTEELPQSPDSPDPMEPQLLEGAKCPVCGAPMKAITHTMVEDEVEAFPDGRLVIYAPFCDALLYDGEWPYESEHGLVPAMQFKCYDHPRDPIGISETTMDQHVQVISNAIMRRSYDSIMSAPNVVLLPGSGSGGLKSSSGEVFQFTDEPWQFAYFDDPGGMASQGIKHFQANPVPAGVFQFYSLVQQAFRADIGTAEVSSGVGSADIKDVPVGTVRAFVESGSIPTDHKIRRLRRELSIFFTAVHDMQRSCYTTAKWIRLKGPDGQMLARRMRVASVPSVDITVTAQPEFKAMTKEELDTIQLWASFGFSEAIGELLNVPPTTMRKLLAEQQQKQQQAQQAAPPAGMGPGGNGAPPAGPPGAPPSPGGPPNGMQPSPQVMAALMARLHGGAPVPMNGSPVGQG